MPVLEEGCWKLNCQGKGKWEDQREGSWMQLFKEGMKEVGVNEGGVHDRTNWRATPSRIKSSRKKKKFVNSPCVQ